MDDQNQTNQPLGQGMNPSNPNIPEDITPKDAPLSPVTPEPSSPMMAPAEPVTANEPTDLYTTNQPTAPISTAPIEPVQMPAPAAETPFSPPTDTSTVTTEMPEIPTPTPMAGEQPAQTAPTEPALPEAKPKKKVLPVIGGIVALLLVAGVAGAAYYVSNQLSSRQAVAPTAPESKPMAAGDCEEANPCCLGVYCSSYNTMPSGCSKCNCGTTTNPNWKIGGNCGGTAPSCASVCGDSGGGGGGSTGDCPAGQYKETEVWGWHDNPPACGEGCPAGQGKPYRCNWSNNSNGYSCVIRNSNDHLNACKDASGVAHWEYGACVANAGCATCGDPSHPVDDPITAKIKFSRAGKITLFTRNMAGIVTLTGPKTVTINSADAGAAVKQGTTFTVSANEEYSIQVRLSAATEQGNPSYGWIANKAATKCGPVKTPGEPLDANNKATGKCGVDADISSLVSLASANSEIAGITAGGAAANIQCWGDWKRGDATQDYDFNDFTLIFGYEKVVVDDCAPKYFCNTNSYTCQATTGTYHDLAPGASDFVSCVNTNTCAQNLAADTANPDTGKCYATQLACENECIKMIEIGACTEIKIFKKVDGVYGTRPLTQEELQKLKVGDILKLTMTVSPRGSQGKFRVLVNDVVDMDWTASNVPTEGDNWTTLSYEGYAISKPGLHKFVGQVTTP